MALLKDVSRSFYLTLRVLPGRIRPQIGLAYLLARTTDTIADTGLVPVEQRLAALAALRERILGLHHRPLELGQMARRQGSPAEARLLEQSDASLASLAALTPDDRELVRRVLDTITSGQELDLRRFAGASTQRMVCLPAEVDLDDYTYRVAGCVGEFWTRICRAAPVPARPAGRRLPSGERRPLRQGTPARQHPPGPARRPPAGPLLSAGRPAGRHRAGAGRPAGSGQRAAAAAALQRPAGPRPDPLARGWEYTHALPRRSVRVRLACAWPILIGLDTIRLLRSANVLDPARRVKLSRPQVRRLLWRSVLYYPFPAAWRALAEKP